MIQIAGDFHTHTVHSPGIIRSHGIGTVEDNVKAAIDRGLKAVAISDHGMAHPFYGVRDVQKYLHDIEDVRSRYSGQIYVYAAYEANLLSLKGRTDLTDELKAGLDFPFFGYHRMVRYPNAADALHFMLPKSQSPAAVAKNTQAYIAAMDKNPVRMISHPGYGLPVDKTQLARAAAARNVALEINASHPEFTADELREAAAAGATFMINSDAHSPSRVGDFRAALERAEEAGISPAQIRNSDVNIDGLIRSLEEQRQSRGPTPFRDVLGSAYSRV